MFITEPLHFHRKPDNWLLHGLLHNPLEADHEATSGSIHARGTRGIKPARPVAPHGASHLFDRWQLRLDAQVSEIISHGKPKNGFFQVDGDGRRLPARLLSWQADPLPHKATVALTKAPEREADPYRQQGE